MHLTHIAIFLSQHILCSIITPLFFPCESVLIRSASVILAYPQDHCQYLVAHVPQRGSPSLR